MDKCIVCKQDITPEMCGYHGISVHVSCGDGIASMQQKIEVLEDKVLRIVRGDFNQICSYCGWESMGDDPTWEQLQRHIQNCKLHPATKARKAIDKIIAAYDPTRPEEMLRIAKEAADKLASVV